METGYINKTYYLQIFLSENGKGVAGKIIDFKIFKSQGGVLIRQGTMVEDLTTPGVYVKGYTFTQTGQYRILYIPPDGFQNSLVSVNIIE